MSTKRKGMQASSSAQEGDKKRRRTPAEMAIEASQNVTELTARVRTPTGFYNPAAL